MSDDSTEQDEFDASDSDNDLLPIEKQNMKLKKKQEKEEKLADDEMQMNISQQDAFKFPDEEGEEEITNLRDVQQRIRDIVVVLSDFNKLRDKNRSRTEYTDLLRKDLSTYYSYNEFLMERLMQLFPLSELMEFLEACEIQRPLTIRTNSLKTRRRDLAQALINRGVNLDPVGKWSKVGLVVYSAHVPMGATPEYLAGHYIIQGASSLLPVMALAPQENERILDMCAAPGGKASHIAAVMKNTGVLFVNDVNKDRIKAVVGNFHRLGIVNSVISTLDGRKFSSLLKGFDRVLLDAPCTGTGVLAKDESVKTNKDELDIQRCYNLQRELLLSAIDSVNAKSSTGGYIVYSTCSVLPEENEWVIDYALKKRNVKLVSTGLDFGSEGFTHYRQFRFHPSLKLTKRFYPHTHNMDGFFVAKLKKFSDTIPKVIDADEEETPEHVEDNTNDEKIKKVKRKRSAEENKEVLNVKKLKIEKVENKKTLKGQNKKILNVKIKIAKNSNENNEEIKKYGKKHKKDSVREVSNLTKKGKKLKQTEKNKKKQKTIQKSHVSEVASSPSVNKVNAKKEGRKQRFKKKINKNVK